jgi:hypothetical protein
MRNSRLCWLAVCAAGAVGLIVIGAVALMPWVFVPALILLAYSLGPLVTWWKEEHRIRVEAARGIERVETWLRTAPALTAASLGAARECCPICGAPVDPRNARCRRHGVTR